MIRRANGIRPARAQSRSAMAALPSAEVAGSLAAASTSLVAGALSQIFTTPEAFS